MEETQERKQRVEEKRKEFESRIMSGQNRWNPDLWIEFAKWEMRNNNFDRARRVFTHALARLPSWFVLWYQYIEMEQKLGNIDAARKLYEKATTEHRLTTNDLLWLSYAKFEARNGDVSDRGHRVRAVFERFVNCYKHAPEAQVWIWYANFERDFGGDDGARNVYDKGIDFYAKIMDHGCNQIAETKARVQSELLVVAFADFEVRLNEIHRARCVYKRAIDKWPMSEFLYDKFVCFKSEYGNEDVDDLRLGESLVL